ncbi:MAG: GYD domain-containing protein [Pirellulales bacterium]
MARFISTVKFTEQGIKNIQDTTRRAAALKASAKKLGVKITDVYWTLGAFDGVLIFDAADDETATGFLLHVGAQGNVLTQTGRAFNAAEVDKILGGAKS